MILQNFFLTVIKTTSTATCELLHGLNFLIIGLETYDLIRRPAP